MYIFELILISQLHPYEKYREKGKNTDWILKQLLEKKKSVTEKKLRTPVLEVFEKYQD